ncbi:hypothetical protein DMENIID0001_049130 [Sergentomyia squamirostris]
MKHNSEEFKAIVKDADLRDIMTDQLVKKFLYEDLKKLNLLKIWKYASQVHPDEADVNEQKNAEKEFDDSGICAKHAGFDSQNESFDDIADLSDKD